MNVFLCGQKEFGAAAFRSIRLHGHEIVGVCCPLSNGRGDGPDRLLRVATTFQTTIIPSGTLGPESIPSKTDVIVSAHSHDFISRKTRSRAKFGAIGYHPSLLPRHRGRDAVRWAIKFGDPVTGGTVYWLNETMDGGPIAAQEWCWIRPGDTAESLWRRDLFGIGIKLLMRVLDDLPTHFVEKVQQDQELATFEPACNPPRAFRPDLIRIEYSDARRAAT